MRRGRGPLIAAYCGLIGIGFICLIGGVVSCSLAHAAEQDHVLVGPGTEVVATPPTPHQITITASPQEVQQLGVLLARVLPTCGPLVTDNGQTNGNLMCAQAAVVWAQRLQAAVDEAGKAAPAAVPDAPPAKP
jgi:hypothetical protein